MSFWTLVIMLVASPPSSLRCPRRRLLTPHILALFKRILAAMSDTERDALEAGTT